MLNLVCAGAAVTKVDLLSAGTVHVAAAGAVPAWLERVSGAPGEPLEIYRVNKHS